MQATPEDVKELVAAFSLLVFVVVVRDMHRDTIVLQCGELQATLIKKLSGAFDDRFMIIMRLAGG